MALFEVGGVNSDDRFDGLCAAAGGSDLRVSDVDAAGGLIDLKDNC